MSQKTSIEWARNEDGTAGMTWNAVRGCTKISPGCKHCYAETFAERWRGVPGHAYEQGFDLRLVPEKLSDPLRRRKPTTYFVNSMSDLFHEDVPFEFIAAVFGVMAACQQHTYQVLTKRPQRRRAFFAWVEAETARGRITALGTPLALVASLAADYVGEGMLTGLLARASAWPLGNVWEGVSVEDRKYGVPRIDELRATPAAVRFLSVEPLLEDLGTIDLTGISWVIVGGESGPGARPINPDWARSIRDQCVAAGVPFLFKQWGAWAPNCLCGSRWPCKTVERPQPGRQGVMFRCGKKGAGRELDGRTWDEMPRRRA